MSLTANASARLNAAIQSRYSKDGTRQLALDFGVTRENVRHRAWQLGIRGPMSYTESQWLEMIAAYRSGMNLQEAAAVHGAHLSALRNQLVARGIPRHAQKRRPVAGLKHDYFDHWSANMAWLLGYTWTDGNISTRGGKPVSLGFECSAKDEYILCAIQRELNSSVQIKRREPRSSLSLDEQTRSFTAGQCPR